MQNLNPAWLFTQASGLPAELLTVTQHEPSVPSSAPCRPLLACIAAFLCSQSPNLQIQGPALHNMAGAVNISREPHEYLRTSDCSMPTAPFLWCILVSQSTNAVTMSSVSAVPVWTLHHDLILIIYLLGRLRTYVSTYTGKNFTNIPTLWVLLTKLLPSVCVT